MRLGSAADETSYSRVADPEEGLATCGFAHFRDAFRNSARAFDAANAVVGTALPLQDCALLEIVGDFVIPPADGGPSRDFQTLHFDFGVPLHPVRATDVARFTALFVTPGARHVQARTRLVPLGELLAQRSWASPDELLRRFIDYGVSHGAWDSSLGYTEGSLARIVEAASGETPVLPSVSEQTDFLCGNEFASTDAELEFFQARGLSVPDVAIEVDLRPGELLVFDNLLLAHGRRGVRQPGELRQRVFGHTAAAPDCQKTIRDRVLAAFRASSYAP